MSFTTNPDAPPATPCGGSRDDRNVVTIRTRVRGTGTQGRGRGDSVQPGHFDVEECDVGGVLVRRRDDLVAAPDLRDDRQIRSPPIIGRGRTRLSRRRRDNSRYLQR
ncbi:hypothetical protein M2275_008258 [Rhodococcus opacus]|nr:hypothetical protein [Rhodococcus opacus]